ncbi:UDP-N-acetylmuramoyl-tripeptide--D-alanyl-D-alanine ligase [Thermomonas sp. LB-4]|uniref:UDP-N-acetylmuramoyl-tripeptide--D-alanyl-D- alanine ligase n=1 Tax=Thermomonas sp. LB-4 TaxID=3102790 RepID=UPI002ED968BF
MTPRLLSWIAQATGGRLVGGDRTVDAIATDTRALPGGDALFVALKGENFDGHAHVQAAADGGCVAALVARPVEVALPQVVVADTERALASLAAAVQRERATRVLAITGSNGKTTVKTLLHSILCQLGGAYANPGNRNNEIGLPLAVLDAPDDARFAVYEMGAGKPGDIAYLTAIARPDVALVNNVAAAHLERMGSLLGVAQTKGAIYQALPEGGVAVVNADDAFALYFSERLRGRRVVRFGLDAGADVTARGIETGMQGSRFTLVAPQGETDILLPLAGRHNVRNALAAAAMALAVGATLAQVRDGLAGVQGVAGRLASHRLRCGATLVDDSYNANPGSLAAAIDTLAETGGEAWLVLGDMRELGADEAALHAEAGARARAAGIARLYALGPLSAHAVQAFGEGARQFDAHAALADALWADLRAGTTVLVKGSRGSAMDKIVAALLQRDAGPDGETTDAA